MAAVMEMEAQSGILSLVRDAHRAMARPEPDLSELVEFRSLVIEAKRQLEPSDEKNALFALVGEINSTIERVNDEQATSLMEAVTNLLTTVDRELSQGKVLEARLRLFAPNSRRLVERVKTAPTYLRVAITRVGQHGYALYVERLDERIQELNSRSSELEMQEGRKYVYSAKALTSRYYACLENGNIGAAQAAVRELRKPENSAGLAAYLKGVEYRDGFFREVPNDLEFARNKIKIRRRQKKRK